MKKKLLAAALLALPGLAFAASFVIPPDQPICHLYSIIQVVGTIGGIIAAAYAGLSLATNHEPNERNNAKMLLMGVILGLIVIWMAPLLVQNLVGAAGVCGW